MPGASGSGVQYSTGLVHFEDLNIRNSTVSSYPKNKIRKTFAVGKQSTNTVA